MKKHFFYLLLTAFVFNFLFLNNFALAQTVTKLCSGCQRGDLSTNCQIFEEDSITEDTPDNIQCCTINYDTGIVEEVNDFENCAVGGLGDVFKNALDAALKAFLIPILRIIFRGLTLIINIIALVLWTILMLLVHGISSVIDFVSNLNPFEGENAPAKALWDSLKTWGYIILTFVGLYAGFQWLFGEDTKAKKLIFNILLVALLINFTFLFVQEAFNIVWRIEKGIGSGSVGNIFRDTAIKTSPWELASDIKAVNMPGSVDLKSNFIEGLAQNLMHYITGIIRIDSDNTSIFSELMKTMFASLLSVVFTFIVLLITFIALVLYVARYFVITFLAALSSVAIASIAFPEIKVGGKSFSLNLFDQWFSYFVRWVLVIPVFLILFLASHNLFSDFINKVGANVGGSIPELAQLIFSLLVIIGSFLLSITFAVEFTGAVASLAQGFVLGLSASLGGLAVGKALELSGNKIAGVLEKTGGKIAESPLPMALRARGVQLQKKAEELRESVNKRSLANRQAVVNYHLERFTQAKDKGALQVALTLIEQEGEGWRKTKLIQELSKLSDKNIETILTDKDYADEARRILSLMGSSEAPREAREKLSKVVKGMPTRKLILASMNQALYEMWDALHAEVQRNFLEAIEDLKKEDLIKEFAKLEIGDWQNFYNLSRSSQYQNAYKAIREKFDKASHNAFTGFIEAVVNNNIKTLRANIPFYPEIFRHLNKIADLIGPKNAQRLLIEGLRTAPSETIDNFYPTWVGLISQQPQSPLVPGYKRIIRAFSNTDFWDKIGKNQQAKIVSILRTP